MPAISNTTNHARARSLASAYTLDRDTDCRVASCLGRPACRQCLEAINASTNAVHTEAMWDALSVIQLKEVETTMIQVLLFNPSCAATVKSNSMIMALSKTLDDLGGAGMMTGISTACIPNGTSRSTCPRRFGMVVGPCAQVVYNEIMTNQSGRLCFSEIYAKNTTNSTLHKALRSQACQDYGFNNRLIKSMWIDKYLPTDMLSCVAFPTCSYLKHVCNSSAGCTHCLSALERGDGAGAAHLCPYDVTRAKILPVYNGSTVNDSLDFLVRTCSAGTPVACDYWQARCADNYECVKCSSAMQNGDDIESFMTDSCTNVIAQRGDAGTYASRYIQNIAQTCPGISACRRSFSLCVYQHPSNEQHCHCSACITNSTGSHLPEYCSELLPMFPFDVVCRPCPESVYVIL